MKFNPAHFDIRDEIDKRVQIEDWAAWGAKPVEAWKVIPDQPMKSEPPLVIVKRFVMGLRP